MTSEAGFVPRSFDGLRVLRMSPCARTSGSMKEVSSLSGRILKEGILVSENGRLPRSERVGDAILSRLRNLGGFGSGCFGLWLGSLI